jgi:phage gp46-like protein
MTAIQVNLRANEGCAPQPVLFWDAVWDAASGTADWALAGPTETVNVGGLKATEAIETAVTLCLWTDRLCPPDHPLAKYIEADDPRGWWGDGIDVRADLGETPLGSLLWLLERAAVTPQTVQWTQALALDALAPMLAQDSVSRVDAQASSGPAFNQINLAVQVYGRDGAKVYDRRFDDIWAQLAASSLPPRNFDDNWSPDFA